MAQAPDPTGDPQFVTPETGLTAAQVAERVASGRTNDTGSATSRSVWEIVKANVFTRFNAILGALFVLILATGSLADGLFGVVLVVNSGIGIVQEYLAKRKLDRLALLNAPTTRVVRDGQVVEIPTIEVVADDLIELRTGDQVPADGELLAATGLEINESNLTGESDSIPKAAGDKVMSGTSVVAGTGRFPAAAVGPHAYANKIAAEAKKFTKTHSEIQSSVNTLLKYITWVVIIALPLQIWSQYRVIGDQGWREVVIRSTGGLVGLVPEGLVLLTSVAFLLAAVQLTRQQVLVQELPAVEGLARVDVVCLDKTGTLTVGDIIFEDLLPLDAYDENDLRAALGALADDPNANGTLKAVADAVPAPSGWNRRTTIAFNSARKWSAATFEDARGTWVMGAPDVLLSDDDPIRGKVSELAATGRRVLLLSNTDAALSGQELPAGMVPRALVVLAEQVRPDAKDTLDYFKEQGVAIKIISGDNPTTVAAIARRVGLEFDDDGFVDARTIGEDAEELREIVEKTTVFGRVSPEQKRALVNALKMNGHVAAMTGDGVNDALALKDADIGVAMNNGAQATKAVAQLVLLDGKFSHLPSVLAEGRRVIGNVERVANLFVAKNVMSLIAIVSAAVASMPFPFLPRHLTLVSALTIGIPAFFLALGPNKRRYVPGFLKRVLRFAVPSGVIAGVVVLVSYLLAKNEPALKALEASGQCRAPEGGTAILNTVCWHPGTAATIALMTTFFWILIVLARPFRMWKAGLIAALILLTILAFWLPMAREFFNFEISSTLLWESLLVGAVGAVLVEIVYRTAPAMRAAQNA
ncbi:HAD-IC family P-type ATPase [Nakamurella sp. YIM 132087]|uniref:HAD-IC family P-type ATPase n=1 Tax=Nakamurella alba TaxID=2665158 RepID=A0A7K1FTV4_9ACTN|nr:HAD-IC family P-type ATPase [Nakamurella alba]